MGLMFLLPAVSFAQASTADQILTQTHSTLFGLSTLIVNIVSLVMGLNMRKVSLVTEGGIFEGYIDFYVHDKDALDRMIRKLNTIEGLQSVIRTDI